MARPSRGTVSPAEQALRGLVARREELVVTRAAEKTPAQQTDNLAVQASIAAHLAWLDAEVRRLEAAIDVGLAPFADDSAAAWAAPPFREQ